jgi:hypothetical protein
MPALRVNSGTANKKTARDGYQSDTAARFAGKQVLADFLFELLKEEKRK